jgi:hypothetical protein
MRIPAYCTFCRRSIEALVISVQNLGSEVEVEAQCDGKTYMRDTPHILIQRMRLTLWQTLRAKHGNVHDEEDIA